MEFAYHRQVQLAMLIENICYPTLKPQDASEVTVGQALLLHSVPDGFQRVRDFNSFPHNLSAVAKEHRLRHFPLILVLPKKSPQIVQGQSGSLSCFLIFSVSSRSLFSFKHIDRFRVHLVIFGMGTNKLYKNGSLIDID